METIKTKNHEFPCFAIYNLKDKMIGFIVKNVSITNAAKIFSDVSETSVITISAGEQMFSYVGYTNLSLIVQKSDGIEIALNK